MRVAIVGSRDHSSYDEVSGFVARLAEKYPDAIVVSGGCRGVDQWAELAAQRAGLETQTYSVHDATSRAGFFVSYGFVLPDGGAGHTPLTNNRTGKGFFSTFGKAAAWRNERIAVEADVVVAFWDGKSSGTRMTLDFAESAGTLVCVRRDGRWVQ